MTELKTIPIGILGLRKIPERGMLLLILHLGLIITLLSPVAIKVSGRRPTMASSTLEVRPGTHRSSVISYRRRKLETPSTTTLRNITSSTNRHALASRMSAATVSCSNT
jgi:hypothetical protein